MWNLFRKIIALLKGFLIKYYYFRKLEIKLPFLFFSVSTLFLKNGSRTIIGKKASFAKHVELIVDGQLIIGENFCINKYSRIVAFEKINIGKNVTIAQFVSILDHDHAYQFENGNMKLEGYTTKPINIGNFVWIGDKVTICKGVNIGNNVIIGANSLVNKDIENNCIAGGIPCKKIKSL